MINVFYSFHCRSAGSFFVAACSYIKQKLPLNNELLKHAEVADVQLRVHGVSYTDLDYFLERFLCLLPKGILFM